MVPVPRVSARWRVAAAGVAMQMALGAMHAWSVYVTPLVEAFGWTVSQVTLTYAITNLAFGIAAFAGGLWMAKAGPRTVGVVGGTLYGLGVVLASLSVDRLWVLYLTYGLLAGTGIGMGYIVPITTLLKWFPERRGFITGIAVAGFGFGGLVTAPLAARLVQAVGVLSTFAILGVGYLVVVAGTALFMTDPPRDLGAEGCHPKASARRDPATNHTLKDALRSWRWYALWTLFLLNGSAGKSLISQAAPMARELTGAGAAAAAGMIGMVSIGNGAGRFLWAWLSDGVGRQRVFAAMFIVQAFAFLLIPQAGSLLSFTVLAFVVLLCFGGGLGTAPAFAADCFGSRHVGTIYGLMLTASGLAGVLGPLAMARIRDTTGTYLDGLGLVAAVMLVSAAIPFLVRPAQPRPAT